MTYRHTDLLRPDEETQTTAEQVARLFNYDPHTWHTRDGRTLQDVVRHLDPTFARDPVANADRYTFPDGSTITEVDGVWREGCPACFAQILPLQTHHCRGSNHG
jgi:hypothetical protein